MAFEINYRKEIALTTGGTVTLTPNYGLIGGALDGDINDAVAQFRVTGTQTLTSNFLIVASGTIAESTSVDVLWEAVPTLGAFSVSIFGLTMPAAYVTKKFNATFRYASGAWYISAFCPLVGQSQSISGDALMLATVESKHIVNEAISYAQIQNTAAYSLVGRNAAGGGVVSAISIAAQSLVVRLAAGFVSLTPSVDGQTIIRRAGALVAAALNFTELTGTIANAQVPDDELTLIKQKSTGLLSSAYSNVGTTAVTTEETLFTYTLPASTVASDGKGIRIKAAGSTAANGTTKTIKIKIDGNVLVYNLTITAPNNDKWVAEAIVLRSGATTSSADGIMHIGSASEAIVISAPAITWANTNDIVVTGQNGTSGANNIVCSLVTVELLK